MDPRIMAILSQMFSQMGGNSWGGNLSDAFSRMQPPKYGGPQDYGNGAVSTTMPPLGDPMVPPWGKDGFRRIGPPVGQGGGPGGYGAQETRPPVNASSTPYFSPTKPPGGGYTVNPTKPPMMEGTYGNPSGGGGGNFRRIGPPVTGGGGGFRRIGPPVTRGY